MNFILELNFYDLDFILVVVIVHTPYLCIINETATIMVIKIATLLDDGLVTLIPFHGRTTVGTEAIDPPPHKHIHIKSRVLLEHIEILADVLVVILKLVLETLIRECVLGNRAVDCPLGIRETLETGDVLDLVENLDLLNIRKLLIPALGSRNIRPKHSIT